MTVVLGGKKKDAGIYGKEDAGGIKILASTTIPTSSVIPQNVWFE